MRRICRLNARALLDHGLLPLMVAVVRTSALPPLPVERGADVVRGVESERVDAADVRGASDPGNAAAVKISRQQAVTRRAVTRRGTAR